MVTTVHTDATSGVYREYSPEQRRKVRSEVSHLCEAFIAGLCQNVSTRSPTHVPSQLDDLTTSHR
jgi:hypothetical protein